MNQPSFIEAMTGVKSESQAEMTARELFEARAREAIFLARVVVMSSWLVVVCAALAALVSVLLPHEYEPNLLVAAVVGVVFALIALCVGVGVLSERRKR